MLTFSQHLACPMCGTSYDEPAPRNFSFNSPYGACEACDGLGTHVRGRPRAAHPRPRHVARTMARSPRGAPPTRSTSPGCSRPSPRPTSIDLDAPWRPHRQAAEGHLARRRRQLKVKYKNRYGRTRQYYHRVRGRHPVDQAPPRGRRERLEPRAVRGLHAPGAVLGVRRCALKPATLAVTINDRNISEVCDMAIGESAKFLAALELTERTG